MIDPIKKPSVAHKYLISKGWTQVAHSEPIGGRIKLLYLPPEGLIPKSFCMAFYEVMGIEPEIKPLEIKRPVVKVPTLQINQRLLLGLENELKRYLNRLGGPSPFRQRKVGV